MNKREEWAKKVKDRDGWVCVICGDHGTNAHHVYCEGYFPSMRYDLSNGATLCRRCHILAHRGKFGATSKGKYPAQVAVEKLRARACSQSVYAIIDRLVQADVICSEKANSEKKED